VYQSLFLRRCARCGALFGICPEHDRGHTYCSEGCRITARREYSGRSRAKYQRSPEGRLDQQERMRAYRSRRGTRVMEQGSEKLAQSEIVAATEHACGAKVVSADVSAHESHDESDRSSNCALSKEYPHSGENRPEASPPSDAEPRLFVVDASNSTPPGSVGRLPRGAVIYCIVCGRIRRWHRIQDVRDAYHGPSQSLVRGASRSSGATTMRP
jgi:hypothetical protein